MAEVKQIGITLPSGKEVKGNIVTAFQSEDKSFLISYLNDPAVPQPEGMVNLSVSLLNENTVVGIEKNDTATWDPLRDYMRGIITGSSYPTNYINNVPNILSASSETYARHIAVTPDQRDVLQNDYMTKTEVKEEAVAAPIAEPVPEQPAVQDVAPMVSEVAPEVEVPVMPVNEEPAMTSVFDSAPVMDTPVVSETPINPTPVANPVENNSIAESTTNVSLATIKETFMNSVSDLFDQTFAQLSNKEAQIVQMEQELNAKLADANQMLAAAEEAKKDAEAKAAVATVAFNNAQTLNQTPAVEEAVVQLPTPEGPVLAKQ